MEELAEALNIKPTAMEVWANILFLFRTRAEIEIMKDICGGMGRRFIDTYIRQKRLALLIKDELTYEVFAAEFAINRRTALERLTKQPLSGGKLQKLCCDDPYRIFEVYRKQAVGTSFMELILLLQEG